MSRFNILIRLFFSKLPLWLWLSILAPIGFVAYRVSMNLRNIPYWDEFDWTLAFASKLHTGVTWHEYIHKLFSWHNEHSTVTSRLIFSAEYWLTGKIDFIVLGVLGNLFIVGACALLVLAMKTPLRRLEMAVLLGWGVFQLQQHENLFWAGSSIGHFQVVFLGVATMLCLHRGDRLGLLGAGLFSFFSVFNLTQGIAVFPAGALMLALERRWKQFPGWIVWGVAVTALFIYDFQPAGQHGAIASLWPIFLYWLQLLGSSPGLLMRPFAEVFGLAFLIGFVVWILRGGYKKEPQVIAVILFLATALLVISTGRAGLSGGIISSRYVVLSSVIWALVAFAALQALNESPNIYSHLAWIVVGMAIFNVVADLRHNGWGVRFAESRENAIIRYNLTGTFGEAVFPLYPNAALGNRIYQDAVKKGIYQFPEIDWGLCRSVSMKGWEPSGRIQYFVDEMLYTDEAVLVRGWAVIPEQAGEMKQIYAVLQGERGPMAFSTRIEERPDVARAMKDGKAVLSGFRFMVTGDRIPEKAMRFGIGIKGQGPTEFIMTDHILQPKKPASKKQKSIKS